MTEPLNVLIVEDSEDDAQLLVRELERGGYQVTSERVDTPETMTRALANRSWDIVFADYTMPHFSGTAALELLRKSELDIPFIFVSGTMGEDVAVEAMKAGANDYVIKGNLKRLVPAIRRELQEAAVRRQQKLAEEQLKQQERLNWALYEISLAITTVLDLRELLNVLVQKIDFFLPYSAATVRLLNKESGELELVACTGISEAKWRAHMLKCTYDSDKAVVENKAPVAVRSVRENLEAPAREFCLQQGLASYLGLPLMAKGAVLGVLGFYTEKEGEFDQKEVYFLSTLAGQVALAIHNSQLYEKTKG